ncbi:hypothetical protein GTO10_01855 [Candidatus Saccharibacteria bacterium]|nr:hypothetical protein [Candidatus Saccharibacteria bacterium]
MEPGPESLYFVDWLWDYLSPLGFRGFQLSFSVGWVRFWTLEPPKGLGESRSIFLEIPTGRPADALMDVYTSLEETLGVDGRMPSRDIVEPVDGLLQHVCSLAVLLGGSGQPTFQLDFNCFPKVGGPKVCLDFGGHRIVSDRQELWIALLEVLEEARSALEKPPH